MAYYYDQIPLATDRLKNPRKPEEYAMDVSVTRRNFLATSAAAATAAVATG